MRRRGVALVTSREGHGFYAEPHRREFYTHLLDFLVQHIGGAKARAADGGANAAK